MTKICHTCKQEKDIKLFYSKRVTILKQYTSDCKECHSNKSKIKYANKTQEEKDRDYKRKEEKVKLDSKIRRHFVWSKGTLNRHRSRYGYEVNIKPEELSEIAKKTHFCVYCDKKLNWDNNKGKTECNTPTLDRVDNGQILNLNNVAIICHSCNCKKWKRSLDEYLLYMEKELNYLQDKVPKIKKLIEYRQTGGFINEYPITKEGILDKSEPILKFDDLSYNNILEFDPL